MYVDELCLIFANGIIFTNGTTCVGGTFSGDAPSRLDACGTLGQLLLTLQLEAV